MKQIDLSKLNVSATGRTEISDSHLIEIEASFIPTAGSSTNAQNCINNNCGGTTNELQCRNISSCSGADNQTVCKGVDDGINP